MNLLLMLIVGGVVGWLASMVMKTNAQMGMIANVVVGVVGAGIGGWLAPMLGIAAEGIGVWIVSIAGAMLLIGILKVLGIFK